jgi:hypothetical protein
MCWRTDITVCRSIVLREELTSLTKNLNQTVSKGIEIAASEERGGDDQNIILPSGRTIINVIDSVELEENSPIRAVLRINGNVGGTPIISATHVISRP